MVVDDDVSLTYGQVCGVLFRYRQNSNLVTLIAVQAIKLHANTETRNHAEELYRCIINMDPSHADALHMLGALLTQQYGKNKVDCWSLRD